MGQWANSADPDQMTQNAVSDPGLQCLQIVQPNVFPKEYLNLLT